LFLGSGSGFIGNDLCASEHTPAHYNSVSVPLTWSTHWAMGRGRAVDRKGVGMGCKGTATRHAAGSFTVPVGWKGKTLLSPCWQVHPCLQVIIKQH